LKLDASFVFFSSSFLLLARINPIFTLAAVGMTLPVASSTRLESREGAAAQGGSLKAIEMCLIEIEERENGKLTREFFPLSLLLFLFSFFLSLSFCLRARSKKSSKTKNSNGEKKGNQ